MWFRTTEVAFDRRSHAAMRPLTDEADIDSLVAREADVRAFAKGERQLDIGYYASDSARFVDVRAVIHPVKQLFPAHRVLGLVATGFEERVLQFSGTASVQVSIVELVGTGVGVGETQHIVWTMTWSNESGRWDIINSHATMRITS